MFKLHDCWFSFFLLFSLYLFLRGKFVDLTMSFTSISFLFPQNFVSPFLFYTYFFLKLNESYLDKEKLFRNLSRKWIYRTKRSKGLQPHFWSFNFKIIKNFPFFNKKVVFFFKFIWINLCRRKKKNWKVNKRVRPSVKWSFKMKKNWEKKNHNNEHKNVCITSDPSSVDVSKR